MDLRSLLLLLGVFCVHSSGFVTLKGKCSITKVWKMKSADCFDRKLEEIPQTLPNNVEIIDLSYNRIRKIGNNDLEKFGSLKILYLQDNMISKIEENAFDHQDDLTTLDISINGIISIPPVIFQLPSLRNLYLSRNLNINLAETIEKAKPIKSPLMRLDISNNELETLPDLGMIPSLLEYNISGNGEINLRPSHFAGICNLKILDTTNVTGVFFDPCDCINIETWLQEREVKFSSLNCDKTRLACSIPEEDMKLFNECQKLDEENKFMGYLGTIGIPVGCCTLLLLLAISAFFIIRCRKQRRKTKNFISKGEKAEGLIAYKS